MEGRVSWFGGPGDPTAGSKTANNEPISNPGIAVYNRSTLGGYWRVTANNGRTAVLKQTDIGPAPWTGRKIDVTYSAVRHFGYGTNNFPTDSTFKAEYLGKQLPKGVKEGPSGSGTNFLPGSTRMGYSLTPGTPGTFNESAFKEAVSRAQGLRLLGKAGKEMGVSGVGPVTMPTRAEFTTPGTPGSIKQTTLFSGQPTPEQHQGATSAIEQEMNHIAGAHVPYLWGGGHQGRVLPGTKVTPLDCSGAVSAALGINPKVASEFESWGQPGKGSHMTIWASSGHVLMEVHGHFWGTSGTNPGGGAGWIRPGVITPGYLKNFVPRHPQGG